MIPMLLSNLVVIPIYACRAINLSIFMFFKEGFVRPIVAASLFGIILHGLLRFMGLADGSNSSWPWLFLSQLTWCWHGSFA